MKKKQLKNNNEIYKKIKEKKTIVLIFNSNLLIECSIFVVYTLYKTNEIILKKKQIVNSKKLISNFIKIYSSYILYLRL
jgi:hypothetical protein